MVEKKPVLPLVTVAHESPPAPLFCNTCPIVPCTLGNRYSTPLKVVEELKYARPETESMVVEATEVVPMTPFTALSRPVSAPRTSVDRVVVPVITVLEELIVVDVEFITVDAAVSVVVAFEVMLVVVAFITLVTAESVVVALEEIFVVVAFITLVTAVSVVVAFEVTLVVVAKRFVIAEAMVVVALELMFVVVELKMVVPCEILEVAETIPLSAVRKPVSEPIVRFATVVVPEIVVEGELITSALLVSVVVPVEVMSVVLAKKLL